MSFLSAELSASLKTIVATMSADLDAGSVTYERCASFAADVTKIATQPSATAPVVAEKKTKKKATTVKPTVTVEENTLLAPVDATATSATVAVVAQDPYASHKFRIAKPDESLCMGRKIDVKNPIPGTRKGDAGATNIIFPEKQCSKKPLPGQKLCKICTEKHDEFNANPTKTVPKDYYGRLDEPMFAKARVIGCEYFFDKYPNGLADDPSTAPVAAVPATSAPLAAIAAPSAPVADTAAPVAATSAPATEPKVKKPRAKKEKAVVAANTSVAASEETAVKPEWLLFLYEGRTHIRNETDGRTYEADTSKAEREDMVKKDTYKGRWRDGALDIYAAEEDDE